ncbi:hypothetical protein RB200_24695 [Streptomyces sp. PmtG]
MSCTPQETRVPQVLQHGGDGLLGPAEDQVDIGGEAELAGPLQALDDVLGGLLAPAEAVEAFVDLLDAHADAVHPGVLDGSHLGAGEQLRDAFQGDVGLGRDDREEVADDVHEAVVEGLLVQVRGAAAEVHGAERRPVEGLLVQGRLALHVPEVVLQGRVALELLDGEQAVAALAGVGLDAVRHADVEVHERGPSGLPYAPAVGGDLLDRHRGLRPVPRRGEAVLDLVDLALLQMDVDVLVDESFV